MDHLSSSQINLYLLCALKYKYQYIDQLPKPFRPSALAFGSAFHSALAWLHQQKAEGKSVKIEMLHRIFDSDWYCQKLDKEIKFKAGERESNLISIGKEFLNLYLENNHVEVQDYEVPFRIPLKHPTNGKNLGINLEGFIDLLEKGHSIVEFKTSAQSMNINDVHHNIQLSAYGYAYQVLNHKEAQSFKIINFVKGRKPKMIVLETQRNPKDYISFFYIASEVLKGIKANVFPPKYGFWCRDCEYGSICPIKKGYKKN